MKKIISVLSVVFILVLSCKTVVVASVDEPYVAVEEATNSNYYDEYITVRTPNDEPYKLYVEGKTKSLATMFRITLSDVFSNTTIIRTFVRPDENGYFSVKIDTSADNTDYPISISGQVVEGETGGSTNTRCWDTLPGYIAVPTISDSWCRLTVARANTQAQADGVYDNTWFNPDNPLSGDMGFVSSAIVVKMTDNNPQIVKYNEIFNTNATVRANDGNLQQGTIAYKIYTDTFLKDIEGDMMSYNVDHPLQQYQVNYIKSVADEITSDASSNYEKLLKIYEYVASHFYYDYRAWNNGTQYQQCNPYINLYNLRNSITSSNSINGKVGTVCNGYSALVIALCRAEGIPARMIAGYNGSGVSKVWNNISDNYRTKKTHWWAEVYIDGKWLVVDANRGSLNKWERTSWDVADDACWKTGETILYSGLDMNYDQLSSIYCYSEIRSTYNRDLPEPIITSVSTSSGYVVINWEPVDGATGYYIYRGTEDDNNNTKYYDYARSGSTRYDSSVGNQIEVPGTKYYYRVRAKNDNSEGMRSNLVTATVSQEERDNALKPKITSNPSSKTASAGTTVTFTVGASGSNLSYQWQYRTGSSGSWENSPADGNKTKTLSIPATSWRNGYEYRCKVSNSSGTVYSNSASLTVE